jgi:hypothetical protein
VQANGERFRRGMTAQGFDLVPGRHPIIPVMLGDAGLATKMAEALLCEGIYVIGFLVSGRAEGQRPASAPDERGAHRRADRPGGRGLRQGRPRARRHPVSAAAPKQSRRSNETGHCKMQSGTAKDREVDTMKALAKLERAPGLKLTQSEKAEVGHNDVMIRIRKTAICGTDIHIWKWDDWAQKTIPVPMQVGHEYVGEIVEMGQEVRGFASATASPARVTSPAVSAVIAAPAAGICAATPSASA